MLVENDCHSVRFCRAKTLFVESFGGVFRLVFVGVVKFFDDTAEAPTKFGYDSIQFGVNVSRRDSPTLTVTDFGWGLT